MSQKSKTFLKSFLAIALFAIAVQSFAIWQPPTSTAPAGNPEPPINVGGTAQTKSGNLAVTGLRVFTSSIFDGTLQIKTGSPGVGKVLTSDATGFVRWADPQNGGGGTDSLWKTTGSNIYYDDGNVGIGTSTPASKLTILGQAYAKDGFRVAGTANNRENDAPSYGIGISDNLIAPATGSSFAVQVSGINGIFFNTDNGEMVMDKNGKVGIKDVSPSFDLDVNGRINGQSGLCIAGDCKSSWAQIGGGGSQTPWISNINANDFTLYGGNENHSILSLEANNSSFAVRDFIFMNQGGGTVVVGIPTEDQHLDREYNSLGTSLVVGGQIRSTANGFKFPDDTSQMTAATPHGKQKYIHTGNVGDLSSYEFLVPVGVTKVLVTVVAGGGGGSGGKIGDIGGGGGGGEVRIAEEVSVVPKSTVTVFVGGGGKGGYYIYDSNEGGGGDGRNSSFGFGVLGAAGGKGSSHLDEGGESGGSGGGRGEIGSNNGSGGGKGGQSIFGIQGIYHGNSATGYGAGGAGGGTNDANRRGGDGAPGFVIVEW